eukprot:9964987-Alexandrium_andersonii.AAC.1
MVHGWRGALVQDTACWVHVDNFEECMAVVLRRAFSARACLGHGLEDVAGDQELSRLVAGVVERRRWHGVDATCGGRARNTQGKVGNTSYRAHR